MARSIGATPYPRSMLTCHSCLNFTSTSVSDCSVAHGPSIFHFETGKLHRLRLINAGAEGLQRFSIDNHTLTVIANDFVPIVPYETDVVSLGTGQRVDVIVRATGSASGAFWMRSDISALCAGTNQPHALAVIHYPDASASKIPTSTSHVVEDIACVNVST